MENLNQVEARHDVLWRFDTARYTVAFWAEEEDICPEDLFDDERDVEFANEGGSHWFCAMVGVFNEDGDPIGWDSLGGCSYNSFREFCGGRTGYRTGAPVVKGHYFPDLVCEAVARARNHVALQSEGARRA